MSVRLNKVMTTLNIGLDTVYDFLRGKPELGTMMLQSKKMQAVFSQKLVSGRTKK